MPENGSWIVYIIECNDGTLYTGITNDLSRRLNEHKSGKGAKYTKIHGVSRIVYTENQHSRSSALKREAKIKLLSRNAKLALAKTFIQAG